MELFAIITVTVILSASLNFLTTPKSEKITVRTREDSRRRRAE